MSYEEFFRDNFIPLKRYVIRMGARPGEAEDVVQEVMRQAWRNWSTLKNPPAWCHRAAGSELARVIRLRQREELLLQAIERRQAELTSRPPDQVETVRRLLRLLPPAQREVLALTFDGYKPVEIAQLLGKTPATVRANLRQARLRLRPELSKLLEGEA